MRGRELPYSSAYNQVDTGYMQQCYADEGVDRSGEPSVLVRASVPDPRLTLHGVATQEAAGRVSIRPLSLGCRSVSRGVPGSVGRPLGVWRVLYAR